MTAAALYDWFASFTLPGWIALSLVGNFVVFGLSVAFCAWIARRYGHHPLFPQPHPITRADMGLAFLTVLLNSLVGVVGWLLWKAGWIRITQPPWWRTVVDVVLFVGLMDFGMYIFHRVAHHRWIYGWLHARHHQHISVNPISLFVLHPCEVLGFGGLMIAVMMLVPLSGAAVLIYLTLNTLFGTLGHAGVEPFPASWEHRPVLREIGSSSFHAGHHRTPGKNYGFYTLLWDRLFGTLEKPDGPPVCNWPKR